MEAHFRPLLENSAEAVTLLDSEGVILWESPAAERVLGYRAEELVGHSFFDFVYREDQALTRNRFARCLEVPGGVVTEKIRWTGREGELRYLEVTAANHLNNSAVTAVVLNQRDITDRVIERQELRRWKRVYRLLFERNLAGAFRTSAEGQLLESNDALAHMLGYNNSAEMLELSGRELYSDSMEKQIILQRLLREGQLVRHEAGGRRKDGATTVLLLNATLFRDQPYVIEGTALDIGAIKRLEEAVANSEERYQSLLERSLAGVVRSTPAGRILECNDAFRGIFGYASKQEIQRVDLRDLWMNPSDRDAFLEELNRTGSLINRELLMRRKDGSPAWMLTSTSVRRDGFGRVLEIQSTLLDITERHNLETQLMQTQRMEAVGELAGGVAHDFNHLLMVISNYTEFLRNSIGENERLQGYVQTIAQTVGRASALTRQLLAFSRRQVLTPDLLDLNAIIEDIFKLLPSVLGDDIEVTLSLQRPVGRVLADPAQIEQILMNLALNARDALPHGGQLTVETAAVQLDGDYRRHHTEVQAGDYVMLAVSDNGDGIDREAQTRIFEPFFTARKLGKGTRVGLSMVYGIVKQSGGHIVVHSEPGQGTTFKIYFPRAKEANQTQREHMVMDQAHRGTETILLVEDEDVVRDPLREFLRTRGYTVLEARSGLDAINVLQQDSREIHLVLADVVMPGMSGPEMIVNALILRPRLKVLYMSGFTGEAIAKFEIAGLNESNFLQKPFTLKALTLKVRQMLDEKPKEEHSPAV